MNQRNRIEIPETNPYAYDQSLKEETRIYSEEKIAFSTSGVVNAAQLSSVQSLSRV